MSNLLLKKKEKRNENQNKNKKLQDNENGEKKRKRNLNIVEHSIWKKERKKERTDIFIKIDSTSLHRLKKEEKKTEHFRTVIVTLFWLVVKWNFLSLFEFKGDIRIFFSCSYYEIWRKPLTEDFILGLLIFAIILILNFFLEFGVFVE